MLSFIHIAKNTLRESLRDPLYVILLTSALFMIGLFPNVSFFVFRQQVKLILDSSLATMMVFGFAISILCASQTVSREIKQGTVFLLLSKPVPRWSFILAKQLGIMCALVIFVLCCSAATIIALKIGKDQFRTNNMLAIMYFGVIFISALAGGIRNFVSNRSFASTTTICLAVLLPLLAVVSQLSTSMKSSPNAPELVNILTAQLLALFSILTIGAIATTISTKFGVFQTLIFSTVIFSCGLANSYIFTQLNQINHTIAMMFKTMIPNWQFFWLVDALGSKIDIPLEYVTHAFLYMIVYITICTVWSIYIFREREIAA